FGLSVWLGYGLSWLRRLPILFRSEANPADPTRRQWAPLKYIFLPLVLRRCRALLTIGTRNAEFYRRYGIPKEKLFWTPYAVDNDFFQQQRAALQPRRADLRRELGLPAEAVVLLYAGRLAPEKGLDNLLQALHRLAAPGVWLLLAGEGRSRKALEEQARSLPLPRVLFLGLQGQKQLARSYVAADIFVLPSHREPWGLVVNEAMNFALPVLVSERAGAVPDLVEGGENGFVFPPGDPDALAGCLRRLVNDPALRQRMGQRSLERIQAWSHRGSAQTTLQALRFALPERGT
ncbi:glycosyltransferase, partial [Acidobacteriia bacterium AH_259_A11_L15]|nr:glycosyltransferase [Acidobacteriia bacterium AH_259_A11_L15]